MKIHLYAQGQEHRDVFVVADREGLLRLRDVCDRALQRGASVVEGSTADGESFALFTVELDDRDPKWGQLVLPYQGWVGGETSIGPFDILGATRYRDLYRSLY